MAQFAEELKTCLDLFARENLQARSSEGFYREAAHHPAIEHGALEDLAIDLLLRSNVAHKASGKAIASPGGVHYFFDRHGRRAERMLTFFSKKCSGAVFAMFD